MTITKRTIAVAALALFASLALASMPAAGQMDERTKQGTGLVYDSLEAILKDLQNYDFAAGVGAPLALRAYVFSHKDDPQARKETEAALLEFVQGTPAPGGLMAACRALRLIGGAEAVPVLAALAVRPGTTDAARYALERIPGGEADQALIAAMDKAQGDVKRGLVFSLGARGASAAVAALARLAGGKDATLAADAVKALGRIGGTEAVRALSTVLARSKSAMKSEAASALLVAAEGSLESGDKAAAAAIYDKVFASGASAVARQAAFKGRIAVAADPKAIVLRTLAGKEALLYAPALAAVPAYFGPGEIGEVAEFANRLPTGAKVQFTALLAVYPADVAGPFLLAAAEDPDLNVRLAAIRAIASAGDGKSVLFLANKAARTVGAEQEAAREALSRLEGADVDAAVQAHLTQASDEGVKAELIRAASARRIEAAKTELIRIVESGPAGLVARAAAGLRTLGVQGDIPELLALLGGLEDEQARETMQDTIAVVARTNPRELARAVEVKAVLTAAKDPKRRADLLRVLGKIGDDSALALVRAALADPDAVVVDAAVRALAEWPTVAARDDVFEIARSSLDLTHRVLATRAFVRMVGLEPYRAPEGAAADLMRVLALAPRPEEKKLVLSALVRFPCLTSLKTAESLQADPAVAAEAKLAADRIRNALK
jgi:hypothetical protein